METVIPIHGTGRMIPMRRLEFATNDTARFPRHVYAPDWLSEIVCGLDGSRTVRELNDALAPGRVRFGAKMLERRDVLQRTLRMLYSLGALVYALRRPDFWPRTYGFHEVFHTLVIAAAIVHFVAMAGWVVPSAG